MDVVSKRREFDGQDHLRASKVLIEGEMEGGKGRLRMSGTIIKTQMAASYPSLPPSLPPYQRPSQIVHIEAIQVTDTHVCHGEQKHQGGDVLAGAEANYEVGNRGGEEGVHPL